MSTIRGHCPHCGTNKVALEIVKQHRISAPLGVWQWHVFATCGFCNSGVLLTLETSVDSSPTELCQDGYLPKLLSIAPPLPDTGAPAHTPVNVAKFYRQGMENFGLGNWDAAGGMLRKALDVGLKEKFPEIEGKLWKRIEKAVENHQLTPELAEWAHQIRDLGNNAMHEEEPFSKEEAEDMSAFTDLVFRYLFTLPGMLAEARRDPDETSPEEAEAAGSSLLGGSTAL